MYRIYIFLRFWKILISDFVWNCFYRGLRFPNASKSCLYLGFNSSQHSMHLVVVYAYTKRFPEFIINHQFSCIIFFQDESKISFSTCQNFLKQAFNPKSLLASSLEIVIFTLWKSQGSDSNFYPMEITRFQ